VVIDTNFFISAFYLPESRATEVVFLARWSRNEIMKKAFTVIIEPGKRVVVWGELVGLPGC
jgi:predicted nucleic acid-binding protein